jgi:hypothetical protein
MMITASFLQWKSKSRYSERSQIHNGAKLYIFIKFTSVLVSSIYLFNITM